MDDLDDFKIWIELFRAVGRSVTELATNALISPFAWMFVLTFKVFKPGGQVTFLAVFARHDVHVLRSVWHSFGFVAS